MNAFAEEFANIQARAAAFRATNGGYPDPPLEQPIRCAACRDVGWVIVNLGGEPVECTACTLVTERRRARFGKLGPIEQPFDTYRFASFPGIDSFVQPMKALSEGAPTHLYLWGPIGSGKTSLATCVYRAWLDGGTAGMWFKVGTQQGLLQHIRDCYDATRKYSASDLLSAVQTVPLLFLDDIGAERVTDWVAEQLFSVVNSRNGRPTIYTSNLRPSDLAVRLGGIDGERIVSRIEGQCEERIYHVDGPDLRQAKNRKRVG